MIFKPLDALVVICTIVVITIFFINTLNNSNSSSFVKIEVVGREYLYPLDRDEDYTFHGEIGDTTVRVLDNTAKIIESPCSNKTCIKIGEISKSGQSSACLPNRILISIVGDHDNEVDAITF